MIDELPAPDFGEEPEEDRVLNTGEEKVSNTGRKRAPIDQITVVKLARLHCTIKEIAEWFGVNESVIRRRFGELIKQCQAETRARIRQEQLKQALNGNVTMLIFLGKVMLHQREDGHEEIDRVLPWSDEDL